VVLVGPWAIKVPRFGYGWAMGLRGLLANMQEAVFSRARWPELCPVVFALWGGWLIVMRRARPMTDVEWETFNVEAFRYPNDDYSRVIPVEEKRDSFGWLDGRVVAVDYGS
jgi:hypothetical protein